MLLVVNDIYNTANNINENLPIIGPERRAIVPLNKRNKLYAEGNNFGVKCSANTKAKATYIQPLKNPSPILKAKRNV